MNCKPNDLAQVVRVTGLEGTCFDKMLGRPVEVVSLGTHCKYFGAIWNLKSPVRCGCGDLLPDMPDAWLKPFPPLEAEDVALMDEMGSVADPRVLTTA